jgi:NifU-like protein involved in Fe-S cluster formation
MVEAANTMIAMADHAQRGCGSLQASPSMRANPRS